MATKRVDSLDAFRGISSFLIMLTHYLLCVPAVCQVQNFGYLYGAFSWKLPYFFLLSGFVLTLAYRRIKEQSAHPYLTFLKRRIIRIYPLFLVTTLFAAALRLLFDGAAPIEGASVFFNIPWRLDWSLGDLLCTLSLVGDANTWIFNNPTWTLLFEMRYALVFPILYAMLKWRNFTYFILLAISALALYMSRDMVFEDLFYAVDFKASNLFNTLTFMTSFVTGMLLAFNRERLSAHYLSLGCAGRWCYLIVAITLAVTPLWGRVWIAAELYGIISKILIVWGVAMWMVILLNNKLYAKFFAQPALIRLGRSSFSLYMWHMPIFTLLYMLLHEHLGVVWIVVLSIVTSVAVAQLSFRYIESYFIGLNKK